TASVERRVHSSGWNLRFRDEGTGRRARTRREPGWYRIRSNDQQRRHESAGRHREAGPASRPSQASGLRDGRERETFWGMTKVAPATAVHVVILSPCEDSRMHSATPTALHRLAGLPLLEYVQAAARALDPASVTVVGGGQALPLFDLDAAGTVLVLPGNVPLV